jgi:hypothetical protein
VAENNFTLPADNEVCRNSTTIGSTPFRWAPEEDVEHVLVLLDRPCAILTRLAGLGHSTRAAIRFLTEHAPPSPRSNANSNTDTDSPSISPTNYGHWKM